MIEIKNLTKIYPRGKKKALDNVSLVIPNGIFGLIGRNGAGKTTIMRIIATVMSATSGEIYFDGKELNANKDEFRSSLGYLPQSTKLMPRLNIVEFLDYVCIMKGIKDKGERKEKIANAIETVGLVGEEKKRLRNYSGGMLRRAGIAQALIGDPKVLIIDEPTTGLDPEERRYFLNLLSKIAVDRTVIFSTHITADIENLCKNICVLELGEVKFLGEKADFVGRIEGKIFQHIGTSEDEAFLRKQTVVTSVSHIDGKPHIRYVADEAFTDTSTPVEPTLEDAYIYALGGIRR
ncbi:MAG: ATP-binding cassette domain-containing protein [Ruminococcaceae bacterium]|nr:ATP-binding cassette domain-containing protein [Oscillospiraceae bacterium]